MSSCSECNEDPRGVLMLNRYEPCRTCTKKAYLEKVAEDRQRRWGYLAGELVSGKAIAWKPGGRQSLDTGPGYSMHRVTMEYVEERRLENGIRFFIHVQQSWRQRTGIGRLMKSMVEDYQIGFAYLFDTEKEAMASIGEGAKRNT